MFPTSHRNVYHKVLNVNTEYLSLSNRVRRVRAVRIEHFSARVLGRVSYRVLGRVSKSIYIRRQKATVTRRRVRHTAYSGSLYMGTRRYGWDSHGIDLHRPRPG